MTTLDQPYRPIAVGFYLLAVPLAVAGFLADTAVARQTVVGAALVMVALGWLVGRRS